MKTKILLFIAIMSMTLTFAQTSKEEIKHLIKEQSDGIPVQKPYKGIETVYKDSKEAINTVYGDVKSLSPKVESAIKSLATQFKTTTDALWNILVKQQLVYSIAILLGLITTILSWIHFWYRYGTACKNDWGSGGSSHYEITCMMCAAISIAGSIITVLHFNDMLTGFINPEFGALKTIVEIATKLK